MTLTKSHLIDAIAEKNGFNHKTPTETLEILPEIIRSTLASGEHLMLAPGRVVTFKCSGG